MIKMNAKKPFHINIIQVYAPTSDSSADDFENFYDEVERALKQCKLQENTIIQGDFNTRIGGGRSEDTTRPYGLGSRNERGDFLVEWAKLNYFIVWQHLLQGPQTQKMDMKQPRW